MLGDPALAWAEDHWVQATLTDAVRPAQPMDRLRARFPHTLVLAFAPDRSPAGVAVPSAAGGRSDHAVSLDFVEAMRTDDESALLLAACDACAEDPDADVLVTSAPGAP